MYKNQYKGQKTETHEKSWVGIWDGLEFDGWLEHLKNIDGEYLFIGLYKGYGMCCTRHYTTAYPEMFAAQ